LEETPLVKVNPDNVAPIVNGKPADLSFMKTTSGVPVTPNPNFQQPIVYQRPFAARFGAKLSF